LGDGLTQVLTIVTRNDPPEGGLCQPIINCGHKKSAYGALAPGYKRGQNPGTGICQCLLRVAPLLHFVKLLFFGLYLITKPPLINRLIKKMMKSEMRQCACCKCKQPQNEVLMYEQIECSHVLHGIFTLLTFFWAVGWYIFWQKAKSATENNKKLALSGAKCKQCGGRLMLLG